MNKKKDPKQRYIYRYAGPVTRFGRIVSQWWTAATTATSDAEAKRNLCAQFRLYAGLEPNARIELDRQPYVIGIEARPVVKRAEQIRLF